jgi:hypothetical protein
VKKVLVRLLLKEPRKIVVTEENIEKPESGEKLMSNASRR